jgi:hypothetical protein
VAAKAPSAWLNAIRADEDPLKGDETGVQQGGCDADRHAEGGELHAAPRGVGFAEGAERDQEEEGGQEIGEPPASVS